MTELSELELLASIAERPHEEALRLVYADWLAERGDPRAEVIALEVRGGLSKADRRRLDKLVAQHAKAWLGPLAEIVETSRFDGGFPAELRFAAAVPDLVWRRLEGDVRLGTVTGVSIAPGRTQVKGAARFLASQRLRQVKGLELDAEVALALGTLEVAMRPETFGCRVLNPEAQLTALAAVPALAHVRHLELSTHDFLNPEGADELASAVGASGWLGRLQSVTLTARFGTLEGTARWLVRGARHGASSFQGGSRWAALYGEAVCALTREGGGLEVFSIELGRKSGTRDVGARIASAVSVLALLAAARPSAVVVESPPGGRLRPAELDALRAAIRRVPSVARLTVGGVTVATAPR